MPVIHYLIYLLLFAFAVLAVAGRKLTVLGGFAGFVAGVLVYTGTGYTGIAMLALFFVAGVLATRHQRSKKDQLTTERDSNRRTAGQVLANGGVAAISGLLGWLHPAWAELALLTVAGSLSAATADTLSSELGTVYGRSFFNILTFKQDQPGLDGVISLEGTLIGVWGSALIAAIYYLSHGMALRFIIIVIAGTIGNLTDSVLGATLERKHRIGNNTVNFLTTLSGALACLLLAKLLP